MTVARVGFSAPDAALYDPGADLYLVSNIVGNALDEDGQAFISRVRPDGTVQSLRWIEGGRGGVTLNAPKGMAIVGEVLYVADIRVVRRFDRTSGRPLGDVLVPGATFLNGVGDALDGGVLVSDSGLAAGFRPAGSDGLYRLDDDGRVEAIARGPDLGQPNGVVATSSGTWVVSFGSGELYSLGPQGRREAVLALPKGSLYGIVALDADSFVISSWEGGALYRCSPRDCSVLATGLVTPGHLGLDTRRKRLLVPLFHENALVIYPL